MRTISENIQSRNEAPFMRIPVLRSVHVRREKKSCFYELGGEKNLDIELYPESSETELLKYIRSFDIEE